MGKSTNGPDWADVALAMTGLGEIHSVDIILSISLPLGGRSGLLAATATAKLRAGVDTARAPSVSRSCQIGSGEPSMVAASMFRLMYELDRDCSTFWTQEQFPRSG